MILLRSILLRVKVCAFTFHKMSVVLIVPISRIGDAALMAAMI
jgi:hypothetical protein